MNPALAAADVDLSTAWKDLDVAARFAAEDHWPRIIQAMQAVVDAQQIVDELRLAS